MFKSQNIIFFLIVLFLFSCKDNAQTNNSQKTTSQKELNFDKLLKCSDYSYDEDYFLTADYGCIYDPKGNNNFGNVIIYLVQKKKQPISDEQISSQTTRVNSLSIAEYKKEFKIYLFLIDKQYLNYAKADPSYYEKSKYKEEAYTFDDKQNKWVLIDSINILNQNLNEQTWRKNIVSKSDTKDENKEVLSLEKWTGIYINSDNQKLSSYQEIKNRIGWYELKITPKEITFSNDTRMESEFPTESPGGYAINYDCDYNISGNTLKLYEKNENDTSPSKNVSGNGQKLVLELTKKEGKYYAVSPDIQESENLDNAIRKKGNSPYLFYRFDINITK
ncbi:hypothetical protein [Chryseobacterium sp. c4a]|uniref:hypothetical protein n=1 Tax=Chryseobacterium sp. c4a TaxID=1573582 RepID=UPI00135A5A04|nr:hypothetical protein [Chryseobacterium sp. c4a]